MENPGMINAGIFHFFSLVSSVLHTTGSRFFYGTFRNNIRLVSPEVFHIFQRPSFCFRDHFPDKQEGK